MLVPQQGAEPPTGLREGRHVVRPVEQHAERHLGSGPRATHRGHAGSGGSRLTGTVGPRRQHQIHAVGTTGDTGAARTAGDTGTACDDAGNVAVATDGGTTDRGDAAVIAGGERQPSGRRGPPGQQAHSTGANSSGNEGVPTSGHDGEAARSCTIQPAPPSSPYLRREPTVAALDVRRGDALPLPCQLVLCHGGRVRGTRRGWDF